jgi:hypothetical protein
MAPGAVGLSALLQTLRNTYQRAWMVSHIKPMSLQDANAEQNLLLAFRRTVHVCFPFSRLHIAPTTKTVFPLKRVAYRPQQQQRCKIWARQQPVPAH